MASFKSEAELTALIAAQKREGDLFEGEVTFATKKAAPKGAPSLSTTPKDKPKFKGQASPDDENNGPKVPNGGVLPQAKAAPVAKVTW